jgi:glutamate dehydrogenase
MPFLVDSVTMEVNRHGLALHLISHPIVFVTRTADGTLAGVAAPDAPDARRESFIHVEVDRIVGDEALEALAADVSRVLGDVRPAVDDWKQMRDTTLAIVAEIEKRPPPIPGPELDEGRAFLLWLADNHFTFLGYRRHDLVTVNGQDALRIVPGSSMGILRDQRGKDVATSFGLLPPDIRAYARRPELLVITKSTSRSTVHRPGYLDYVAVKRFDDAGNVIGEDRFLGLFTSTAYSANPADIPLLRRKVANVVARAGCGRQPRRQGPAQHSPPPIRATTVPDREDELLRTVIGTCICTTGNAFVCSCGATRSNVSSVPHLRPPGEFLTTRCARSGRRS